MLIPEENPLYQLPDFADSAMLELSEEAEVYIGDTDDDTDALPYKTASQVLPSAFKTKGKPNMSLIDELGIYINNSYIAAVATRRPILERMAQNESLYKNRPSRVVSKKAYRGAPQHHIPVVGPRLNQRKNAIVSALLSPDNMFFVTHDQLPEVAQNVEQALNFLTEAATFEATLESIIDTMSGNNQCALLVTFQQNPNGCEYANHIGPFAGLKFDVIHPQYFVVFPANKPELSAGAMVGHEYELRHQQVKQKQHSKAWFDKGIISTIQALRTRRINNDLQIADMPGSAKDENVVLLDCLVRWCSMNDESGVEHTYRVQCDPVSGLVYRIEPYELPYCHYISYRFSKDLNAYWSEDSPANDGQSINLMVNDLMNTVLVGLMYQSRKAVLTKGVGAQDSLKEIKPGSIVPVSNIGETQTIDSQMPLSGFDFIMQFLMQVADGALKVPDTITGQQANRGEQTATAQNIKYAGFQLTGQADIRAINPALRQTAMLVLALLKVNFNAIKSVYGDSIKIQNAQEIITPGMKITVAGQSPKASPDVQQAEIQNVMGMFAQIPELQSLILPLVKNYVNQTSIESKEEIVERVNKIMEILSLPPEQLEARAAQNGIPTRGAPGAGPAGAVPPTASPQGASPEGAPPEGAPPQGAPVG